MCQIATEKQFFIIMTSMRFRYVFVNNMLCYIDGYLKYIGLGLHFWTLIIIKIINIFILVQHITSKRTKTKKQIVTVIEIYVW